MRALTIRQPWASLIALGVKTIETRSWRAPRSLIGQTIAIHAGKTIGGRHLDQFGEWTLHVSPYIEDDGNPWQLRRLGAVERDGRTLNMEHIRVLPLGAIVATATLADCLPMVGPGLGSPDGWPIDWPLLEVEPERLTLWPTDGAASVEASDITDQLPYGDFAPGRWAWTLTNVQPTTERCPACGRTPETPGMIRLKGPCDHCLGLGKCPPISAKGKQGLWEWQP